MTDPRFTGLTINPTIIDGQWADLLPYLKEGGLGAGIIRIGNLPAGMASGAPALQIAVQLQDGSIVFAQTSWKLMRAAVRAIDAAWPGWDD